jgi:site-specific recombinase XerD
LFCTLQGEALCPSYVRALLPRLAEKAGLRKRVSAEVLRRTLAAELAQEGYPLRVIQAQLGHVHGTTTERYLGRVLRAADSEDAADAMQRRCNWQA